MKSAISFVVLSLVLFVGCSPRPDDAGEDTTEAAATTASAAGVPAGDAAPVGDAMLSTPIPMADGVATLNPGNSSVQFIGTHVGDNPDPRVGTFGEFKGTVRFNTESKQLEQISMEIAPDSLSTFSDKLTAHLNTPDFLDTREYPTITFESTSVEAESEDQYLVTGNLTLHGVTKEITIPVTATVVGPAMTLKSEFSIDRTEFGMDKLLDRVEKQVDIKVIAGQTSANTAGALGG